MWLANALGKNDDAISQATEALSIELTANLEMPKDDAREFVRQNFPSRFRTPVRWRSLAKRP